MSVFKVKLTQGSQGGLDEAASSSTPSIQRTVYVMGPNRINRLLKDGDTFTDSNYWKRYAYPAVSREAAIVEVQTDDGSVYSDYNSGDNVYPKVYNLTLTAGTTYTAAANIADILTDTGGYAVYAQITASGTVRCKVNDLAIFSVTAANVQVFNPGDLAINKLAFDNSASGSTNQTVEVLLSIRSKMNS